VEIQPLVGKQQVATSLSQASILAYEGAVRSSKTICCLLSFLEAIRNGEPGNLLAAGRTERTLKRNCLDPLVEMLGPKRCKIVSGSGEAWILGRRVYMVGGNDERSQEKLRGLSLVGALVDEASTLPESFMDMLTTRMSQHGAKMWLSSNPEGPHHWLKTKYLDKARLHLTRDGEIKRWPCELCGHMKCISGCAGDGRLDLYRFSFQLDDNPTLPEAFKQQIVSSLSGLHYRRWVLGEWCLAEGLIFDMFSEERHIIRGPLPPMVRIPGVGVDVGTVNPTAALMLGVQAADRDAGTPTRLVLMREYRFDSKKQLAQKTDAELSRDLRAWIGPDRPQWVAVDPSAASFKLQLFRDGMSNVIDANNSVLDGVRLMASLLATGQLVVHESCTGLTTELGSYSWDSKAAERGEDKPLKLGDHSCLVAGTQVRTVAGEVPIEQVKPGDLVATRDGWRPVVSAGMTDPSAPVFDVELSNGETLTGTGNHPAWVVGRGWTNLDGLRYGDRMMSWSEAKLSCSTGSGSGAIRIPSVTLIDATSRLASVIVKRVSNAFTKKCGWLNTARSLTGSMFTTRTTITSTMISRTSMRSPLRNIGPITPRKPVFGCVSRNSLSTWSGFAHSPLSGTEHRKVSSGTASTAVTSGPRARSLRTLGKGAGLTPELVSSAVTSTGLEPCKRVGSVLTLASQRGVVMPAWTTRTEPARSAATPSGSTDTPALNTAHASAPSTGRSWVSVAGSGGRKLSLLRWCASGVSGLGRARIPSPVGSARPAADPKRGTRLLASTSFAHAAGRRSKARRKPRSVAPVRVLRITARSERQPVYNLTVAGVPEYFAGGVLVHNCDAARYAIASTQTIWRPFIPSAL